MSVIVLSKVKESMEKPEEKERYMEKGISDVQKSSEHQGWRKQKDVKENMQGKS